MTETRSFPEAANGLPQVPMEAELWAAGCDLETARFVAQQLERDGFVLIKPRQLWAAHKHFEGERKYALRIIVKYLKGEQDAVDTPTDPDERRGS
jgi:hypothetical protein